MDIVFKTPTLQSECNESRKAKRRYGAEVADRLRVRLDDLAAAANLESMRLVVAARCEELKADRKGQLSVRLPGALRLVFEPAHDPIPLRVGGGLDWKAVTAVRILEIVNYHG